MSSRPPPGGGHPFDPNLVKGEMSEPERTYIMTEVSEAFKSVYSNRIFPHNPPQKKTKLTQMFTVPDRVAPARKNAAAYKSLIKDIGTEDVKSKNSFGPSLTLERMFMNKSIPQNLLEAIKKDHCIYAMNNMLLVKVKSTLLLILEAAPMLNTSPAANDRVKECLDASRIRWLAANFIRFPTSLQVIATQIVRNHARVFSELPTRSTSVAEYQSEVKRLKRYCPGLERALVPESNMPMTSHMEMSWYRIRRRVMESMMEVANKLTPQTEGALLSNAPFGLVTVPKLLAAIRVQMGVCDELWRRECQGEIELSDGPPMKDEEEGEEAMEGEDGEMEREGREERMERAVSGQSMHLMQQGRQMQQEGAGPSSSRQLAPSTLNMNQFYNSQMHQRTQQKRGDTLASVLATDRSMNGCNPRGVNGRSILPNTPTASNGGSLRMTIRKNENRQHFVDSSSSRSLSTTHSAVLPQTASLAATPSMQLQPVPRGPPPVATPSMQLQPVPRGPPPVATPASSVQPAPPSLLPQQTPLSLPLNEAMFGGISQSPQLMLIGADGGIQRIPTVVYVEQTEQGLRQINPPTPQPQLVMAVQSMGGGSGRSGSKRRLSRESIAKRRRMTYGDSGDASSEDNTEDEGERRREKERKKEEKRRKREEEERKEKEEREKREKEEKEEEEREKREKEEEELRRKEEEEKRKKMEEEERRKKEEDEQILLDKIRKEEELKKAAAMEVEEEKRRKEEEVIVLAEDSTEENEKEEEGARDSEDEVVAESIPSQSENEEREKETTPDILSVANELSKGDESASIDKKAVVTNGVAAPPPLPPSSAQEGDSDIEWVFEGPGEKTAEYCEVVEEIQKVKRESNATADNEVICLGQKDAKKSLSRRKDEKKGTLKGWIERPEKVKEEEEEAKPVDNPVKTEEDEESNVAQRGDEEEDRSDTRMSNVKSEVKEEEETEGDAQEKESIDGNGESEENTEHRSEHGPREDEEMERRRIVVETITQDHSSLVPFTVARSDDIAQVVTPSITPAESVPMEIDLLSAPMEESIPSREIPQETPPSILNPPMEPPHEVPQETTLPLESVSSLPPPISIDTISTPSPRPSSIRVSSQTMGEKIPAVKTRLSAEMREMLDRTESLLKPYDGIMKVFEGREKEKEMEKEMEKVAEKEKEETDEIRELPMDEVDGDILRFHTMRGVAAQLSDDRRRAIRNERIDGYSKSLVFTNRPIKKGEKVTLKVIEISPGWRGRVRLGFTTKNPIEYSSRRDIPSYLTVVSGDGHLSYMFDSGVMNAVEMGSILELELNERGDQLRYSFNGRDMGLMGGGIQIARPMWLSVDIYGFVRGIEIVDNASPPQEGDGSPEVSNDDVQGGNNERVNELLEGEKREDVSLAPPVDEESIENAPVDTHVHPQEENGGQEVEELSIDPTENVALVAVSNESNEDTVERPNEEDEGREPDTVVIPNEVMEDQLSSKDNVQGQKDIVEGENSHTDIGEHREEEEDEEPPMKKMRIEQEISDVIMKEGKDGEEEVLEREEGNRNNEEQEMAIVESMNEVIPMDKETEVVRVEVIENEEETDNGKKEVEGKELMTVVERGEEEPNLMVMTNDGEERKGIDNENEMMEKEEEKKDEETDNESHRIEVESIVEDKVEEEESSPLPSRRRSLFGSGCLSFERTLDAKEKQESGDENENEEKMEIDEEEYDKNMGSPPTGRLSLFGPGSVSFTHLVEKMNK